jgi:predicted RNA-binding Zn ribbon-like protein
VFERAAAGDQVGAVDQLNGLLAAAVIRPQISGHDKQDWHLHLSDGPGRGCHRLHRRRGHGLAVMLTEIGIDRFGTCQAPPCRNVFVDTSTNRSRRYCSERCATRANVAAYRARRRAAV